MQKGISGHLRSVISLVDRLRDLQLESYIKLPKIVVVGGQSSGKSSLIEQIVGLDFLPRGTGVVTRRPLEIRMIYQPELKQPHAVFEQIPGKKLANFAQVRKSIQQLTDAVCGKAKDIVDKAIILYIYSPSCPNLTLIDLPGLTRIAIQGQSKDIYKVTSQMIRRYMIDLTSIILCVVPANQDISTDQVLYSALKIDVLGQRTIGCITKIDIMDRGTDARSLLMNKCQVPLKLGYIGIKNRSQADIQENKTVLESLEAQKMFFSKSPIYSSLPPRCLGTGALVESLTAVLSNNIVNFLPQLMGKIKQRKAELHEKIKQYGRPLPKTQQQCQSVIWGVCNQFLSQFKKAIKGHITSLKCKQALSKNASHISQKLNQVLQQQLDRPLAQGLTNQNIFYAICQYQGSNMPGFPSIQSFYYLIDPLLKKMRMPLVDCLGQITGLLNHIIQQIMGQVARQFPRFRDYILQKLGRLVQQSRKKSQSFILQMLQAQINYIYTNNDEFYQLLHVDSKIYRQNDQIQKNNPIVVELKKRVNVYYKLTVKNIRQLIPKNIKYFMLEKTISKIQYQIFQACMGEKEQVREWLKLDSTDLKERQDREREYAVVVKAEGFLMTHPVFAKVRVKDIQKKRVEREKQIKEAQNKKIKEQQKDRKDGKDAKADKQQGKGEVRPQVKVQAKSNSRPIQSPIRNQSQADIPKDSNRKVSHPQPKIQSTQPTQQAQPVQQTFPQKQQQKPSQQKKTTVFANLFGLGPKAQPPPKKQQPKKEQPTLKDQYNKKAGQVTDKAVDQLFRNQTFKKQSTKAVQSGTSAAVQNQLGVSKETGDLFGKGAGWFFKQDATQNYLKQQTKANVKDQVQAKK